MNDELEEELLKCDSLNEMWEELDEWYDLDMPLGKITKKLVVHAFIKHMGKMLTVTRIPERPYEEEEETAE